MRNKDPFFIAENIDSGRRSSFRWVEDSFNPDFSFSGGQDFLSLSLTGKKMKIFLLILFFGLILLAGKSFYLQAIKGDYYFSLAEDNRLRTDYLKAQRGIIYDDAGQVLVQNVSGFSLLITPASLPKDEVEKERVIAIAAQVAQVPIEEIREKIKGASKYYFEPIAIKTGIDYEKAMALKIMSVELPGITLDIDSWRSYVAGESLSHVLGYVGKINAEEYEIGSATYLLNDNIGKTGLEKFYEAELKGEHGQRKVEVDSLGREKKIVSQTPFTPGSDLILSLDLGLQNKIYETLKKNLGDKKAAAVIVTNPQNGEILALVDYPSYNNNSFSLGISQEEYQKLLADERNPLFNRSIAGEYPSGSTIKPVMAAAALNENVIDRNTSFLSVGGIRIGQWFFPDWKAGGHGTTNVIKALAESVNTFFYYIGGGYGDFQGLGLDRIVKYFKLFGLGEKTGVDLPGEKTGFVPTKEWKEETKNEAWYIGDTYHISIGQGDLLVTPIQVNAYTMAVANGGKIYQPHLVKEIKEASGNKKEIAPTLVRQDMVSADTINIVREGMRQTVLSGSARSLGALPVAAAGKTGTAQWNSTKPNHAWFTGFAPFDKPTFAITVLVEAGGEGSSIATPIAKEAMMYWFGEKK